MSKQTYRSEDPPITVYMLHFEPKFRHAQHYVGSAETPLLPARLRRHGRGQGARLVAAALAAGCRITLVKTWLAQDRSLEQKLKRASHHAKRCPLCNPALTTDLLSALVPIPNDLPIAASWSAAEWPSVSQGSPPEP